MSGNRRKEAYSGSVPLPSQKKKNNSILKTPLPPYQKEFEIIYNIINKLQSIELTEKDEIIFHYPYLVANFILGKFITISNNNLLIIIYNTCLFISLYLFTTLVTFTNKYSH